MATGDIKNNIRKLISELKQVSYDCQTIDYDALVHGIPSAFLPIIHYTFLDYSHNLASYLAKKNYELYARTDLRFVETVYKVLMQEFSCKPSLTKEQFLALGFAERKIILLTNIVKFCREKNKLISTKKKKSIKITKSSLLSSKNVPKLVSEQDTDKLSEMYAEETKVETNLPVIKQVARISTEQKEPDEGNKVNDKLLTEEEVASMSVIELPNVSPSTGIGLPLPNLGPFGWSNESRIPQPCESLTVTPLKDVGKEERNFVESVPRQSRADVIEIENVEPQSFRVINHNTDVGDGELSNISDLRKANKNIIKSAQSSAVETKKSDVFISKQEASTLASSDECRCNCKEYGETINTLQNQLQSLQQSVQDLVMINNELSARVVLLETQNKLMEKKIETIEANHGEKNEYRKNFEGRQSKEEPKHVKQSLQQGREELLVQKDKNVYSPDKYTDFENSLPLDFEPIKVSDMIIVDDDDGDDDDDDGDNGDERESVDDDAGDAKAHAIFGYKNQVDDVSNDAKKLKSAEAQSKSEKGEVKTDEQASCQSEDEGHSSEDQKDILSPLRETEFSFMEENTRNTVINLQKRLEETMNLFKSQTKINKP